MNSITVSVVYAIPAEQHLVTLQLPSGSTARQAVESSDLARLYPEIDLSQLKLGIFGRRIPEGHRLEDGDRVEIYRPLLIDPKESRRQRAQSARQRRTTP